jgi:hypothetical protein
MLRIPVLRWGQPYESLEKDDVVHFATGEKLAAARAQGERSESRSEKRWGWGPSALKKSEASAN